MRRNNIILIGMPGSGKSTLGSKLAEHLQMDFIDTDLLIEKNVGRPLQRIIEDDGLERFLEIENDVMLSINSSNTVIATGGSAVLSPEGINHLKSSGVTVYVEISYENMVSRINNIKTRGIVMKDDEGLIGLFAKRTPLYEKYSDFKVNCDNVTAKECFKNLLSVLRFKH